MAKDYESMMKTYEANIKSTKEMMKEANDKLIAESTRKEQYEAQLKDLKKEVKDTFNCSIEDLSKLIDQNMKELEQLNQNLLAIPSNLQDTTQEQVAGFDLW